MNVLKSNLLLNFCTKTILWSLLSMLADEIIVML
ncbi:Uncharacterised protein [Klebsiella pneumoniae]|nr:hypothetical protein AE80_02352 [Klebsiella pneumoniae CHS 24]KLY99005.1 hypothetical protein SL05_02290 [Klebsiella pneumoniae]KMF07651.1 hypothetical protein SM19_02116 [Klebsiella pneumoniae]KMF24477.1 hypothetical protein SM22_00680 [Klebsiella pneumoniae]KMG06220.1 hypothetical protein SM40_02133 [Klebsiella pneumoniae]